MDVIIFLWRLVTKGWDRAFGGRNVRRRKGGTHGSARWLGRIGQLWHGVLGAEGVILGRGAFRRFVRFTRDGFVMVFASTGAGKGLGIVIPTLLSYRGSIVVTDPKGENYAITRRRRSDFGKVYMLNPSDLLHSERFNPLDIIRRGTPSETDDARALANLMRIPDSDKENHWDTKSESLLTALILHTLHEPPPSRTLGTVRRYSVGTTNTFLASLQNIADTSPSLMAREIIMASLTSSTDSEGRFSDEFKSILSSLQKATEPWSNNAAAGQLAASSTFHLSELTSDIISLYLCVEEDVLKVYGPWLRVMVGCILKTLTRAKETVPARKVVLLLDEVAVLGRLEPLESQAGLLRAYCTPVLIWQNLPQIFKVYGRDDAEALLAHASARVFFGINDNTTASYVADMIGNATSHASSVGLSESDARLGGERRQQTRSESGYWLKDPAELQSLPLNRVIVKILNVPHAIFGRRLDYRKVLRWRGHWDRWRASARAGFGQEPVEALDQPYSGPLPGRVITSGPSNMRTSSVS